MSLFDAMNVALSGMQAASAEMNVSASNIANMQMPGYKAVRANLTALPNQGGVGVDPVSIDPSHGPVDSYGQEQSNVDLASEVVNMSLAKNLYNANAVMLKVTSQMTGTLLDMFDHNRGRNG